MSTGISGSKTCFIWCQTCSSRGRSLIASCSFFLRCDFLLIDAQGIGVIAQRESATHFVVEGRHAVERLVDSSYAVEKVIVIGTDLTRSEASDLLGFHFHRSHLAIARKPTTQPELSTFGTGPLVILPEIADPGNLGTIIRNTAALGGSGILLGKGTSPFNAKTVRASAGALFRLPIRKSQDLLTDLHLLATTRTIIGTCLDSEAIPFDQLPSPDLPIAIILGPED
ncbi:hypothetical protein N8597_01670, partial [Akkermansiaceae bacterium]|nr:hypothetical protein [Akkermansiaceae bacterium]